LKNKEIQSEKKNVSHIQTLFEIHNFSSTNTIPIV